MNHSHPYALKVFFPNYILNGAIFSKMTEAPWYPAPYSSGLEMDIAYLSSFSGVKPASQMVLDLITNDVLDQQKLADVLWKIYGRNWTKLWDAYMSEFDPIENYSIEETSQRDERINRDITKDTTSDSTTTGNTDYTDSGTEKRTIDTDTTTKETENTEVKYGHKVNADSEADNFTHGFNDATRVPTTVVTTTSSETHSGSDVTDRTLDASGTVDTTEDVSTTGEGNSKSSGTGHIDTNETTGDNTKDYEQITRNRHGNIGQNTYQELLTQEFNLWKWNFFLQVFSDVDRFITIPYYTCVQSSQLN